MGFVSTLVIDILASWLRLFVALVVSILFSIAVGIAAATNEKLERIILPVLDVLQTIPILGFFPLVIFLIVSFVPGFVGINLAVIFLIFTSMSWNISFGVYEAVKSIPEELSEVASLNHFSFLDKVKRLYIPASMPRIAYQSTISFSIGIFYLATSEIFSTGSKNFAVTYGIGVAIAKLAAASTPLLQYLIVLLVFVIAVVLTGIFILEPFSTFSEKFSFSEGNENIKKSVVLNFYSRIYSSLKRLASRLESKRVKEVRAHRAKVVVRMPNIESVAIKRKTSHIYATIALLLLIIFIIILLGLGRLQTEITIVYALAESFVRVWLVYIVCVAIAIPLGIKIALSKRWFKPSMSVLQVVSAIPATILLPLIILLFAGTPFFGELTALSVIFISMLWYILFSIVSGVRTIPESMHEVANINRLSWKQKWLKLYIPAALPSFVTGSITAVGGAWNSLILAEYFVVQGTSGAVPLSQVGTGIGKLIDVAVFSGDIPTMVFAILSMTIMVIVINRLFWQKVYNRVTTRYKIEVS